MILSQLGKIINRIESAKPHPVLFIGWILLIATIRYFLEIVLVDKFDTFQYIYHTLYYVTIFLFIPTFLLYLIAHENIDRIINVVAFLIFPFKLLSVSIDRLILGNMHNYAYLKGNVLFLLKYIFLLQGETPYITKALGIEWIVISVLIGLYAAYKRKKWWIFPIFALISHALIVFSGAFVRSIIFPVGGDQMYDLLRKVLHQEPIKHAFLEVNTALIKTYWFYGFLFAAISFILFLICAAIYLKERRALLFRRLWWIIPALLIGPFITYPFYVYDAMITSCALLAIFMFAGLIFCQKFLQRNEIVWTYLMFAGYSLLFTIYTLRTYLYYILGSLIVIGMVINLILVIRGSLKPPLPE